MIEPVAYLLRDMGLPWTAALAASGISEDEFAAASLRISVEQMLAFYQQAVRMAPDPVFPIEAGLRFHSTTYGIYGFAILSSPDVRTALGVALAYDRLADPLMEPAFFEGPETAAWLFRPIAHPKMVGRLYEFVVELHAAIFLSIFRDIVGDEVSPQSITLTFRPPDAAIRKLTSLACAPFSIGDDNGVWLPSALLDRRNRMGSPAVNRMLIEICNAELEQRGKQRGLSGRVRELLISNAARATSIGAIADRLNLSQRSLRRRLAEEGTSLTRLQEELRLQLAIKFLRDSALSIDEIAHALGFSEAASFRRGFRRWTGSSPSAFRESAAADSTWRPPEQRDRKMDLRGPRRR